MDRPGVRQVPEGSGEQGKMEKTDCKIICGAPTTLAVKGLMIIIIVAGGSVSCSRTYYYWGMCLLRDVSVAAVLIVTGGSVSCSHNNYHRGSVSCSHTDYYWRQCQLQPH